MGFQYQNSLIILWSEFLGFFFWIWFWEELEKYRSEKKNISFPFNRFFNGNFGWNCILIQYLISIHYFSSIQQFRTFRIDSSNSLCFGDIIPNPRKPIERFIDFSFLFSLSVTKFNILEKGSFFWIQFSIFIIQK